MNPRICDRCGCLLERPLVCGGCGHRQVFTRQPLFCLSGPSGTGKSTVARALLPRLSDRVVVLEQDVLWLPELSDPTNEHQLFRSTWLRLAAMIGQSGRPVLLCGTVVPPELEPLPERALFSAVHYLALTCRPDVLAHRLRARPAWREWDEPRIAEMLDYAEWLATSVDATAREVCGWLARLIRR